MSETPEIIYKTAFDPVSGAFLWVSYGPEGVVLFPEVEGFIWLDGEWDKTTHYVVAGLPIVRPETALPLTQTLLVDEDWVVAGVPAGTEVQIDGEVVGVTDETGLTLSFTSVGVWPVVLRPPFPWIEARCEVTVS